MANSQRGRSDALVHERERLARAARMELIGTLDFYWPRGTELTDEAVEALCDVVESYAGEAYGYAVQYYDESGGPDTELTLDDVYSRDWTAQAVHTAAAEFDGRPRDLIVQRLSVHASRMINRVCGEYVRKSVNEWHRKNPRASGGPRYARVPSPSCTCMFCLMLGSRGWVFDSKETALGLTPDHYHEHCKCTVAVSNDTYEVITERGGVIRKTRDKYVGYDPVKLYDRYDDCCQTIERELRAIERQYIDSKERNRQTINAIMREMRTRDPEWLRGEVDAARISFRSKKLEDDIDEHRPHERQTAERLAGKGIECKFVVDYEKSDDRAKQRSGLADLADGKEMKTLSSASTYSTIDKHMRTTSGKRDATTLYFDNSQNDQMSDEELAKNIMSCNRFKRGKVYIFGHDGMLRRIK